MSSPVVIRTQALHLWYGTFHALKDVTLLFAAQRITSLIGPSGCGKSTLLRCFNRMNERFGNVRTQGAILIHGHDIYAPGVSVIELRQAVGMVFQRPNPLPVSVFENVAFGLRIHRPLDRAATRQLVEQALTEVGLWNTVKDQLDHPATELPLDQQQKLCIARLLPLKPSVILMDEPCSALDVAGTLAVEDLLRRLASEYTILVVTHNMVQAQRISQDCVFMLNGEVAETGPTARVFQDPADERTRAYVSGRYA